MSNLLHYLRSEHTALELPEVLKQPVNVLLGVTETAAHVLTQLGIKSVFDLGSSWIFTNARAAAEADRIKTTAGRLGLVPADWLKPTSSFVSLNDIGNLPLENLRGLPDDQALAIKISLDVTTIRDFAFWPPRQVAHKLVSEAAGTTLDPEEQQSEELRPRFGEYPTERVYYKTLTMLQMDEDGTRSPIQEPISLLPAVNNPLGFGKVAVGALLTYSQAWHAKGVTLGQMLHSLALAPGEATRIAIIDWSRRTRATATEAIAEEEQLNNIATHSRAMSEATNATANDLQNGGSMSSGWAKSSSEATANAMSSGLLTSLFSSGSGSRTTQQATTESQAESTSWSVGSRAISADMTQQVNDLTEQHANSVRNRRASAVREVSQSEHEEVSTRVVANYNHMHALTVQYYEVVQVYQVTVRLHKADRCLFVPFELLEFNESNAMDVVERFRGALVAAALTARARDLLIDETTSVAVKSTAKKRFPGTGRRDVRIGSVTDPRMMTARIVSEHTETSAEPPPTDAPDTIGEISAVRPWTSNDIMRVSRAVGRTVLRPGSDAQHLPDETELLGLSFSGVTVSTGRLDRPGTSAVDNTFSVPAESSHVDFPPGIRLNELDAIFLAKTTNPAVTAYMTLHCAFHGRSFTTAPLIVEFVQGTSMQKVVTLQTDEANRQRELLAHLQSNRAYYSQVIFKSLDPATLVMLLSQFTWQGKPLAEQVEPKPLTVAGNYLIFRAPIGNEDSSGLVEGAQNLSWSEVLEQRGIDSSISDTRLVPIPTGGVFGEAVLGRSNSAEKLDITRFWNWQDSPIPLQPPEIAPVGTGSRGTSENLTPGNLGAPVLNVVNPTSLPDPAGVSASLGALANANLFRDMSGLQGTQSISESGLRETLSAAGQAGQLASTNLKTEAEKAVAMGQIAADIAKTAMGISPTGSVKGISAEGARSNHARDMDEREGPGTKSAPEGASGSGSGPGTSGGGVSGDGVEGNGSMGSSMPISAGFSRERAFADHAALGFSPDAVGAMSASIIPASFPPLDPSAVFQSPDEVFRKHVEDMRNGVLHHAFIEQTFWENNGNQLVESDNSANPEDPRSRVRGKLEAYARAARVNNPVQMAVSFASDKEFWSAAFISYIMEQAGARSGEFEFNIGHDEYIKAARDNRENQDFMNPFWLLRLDEVAPEIGDILCLNRSGGNVSFDPTVVGGSLPSGDFGSHADVVTGISVNSNGDNVLVTLGGNLGESVRRRLVPVDVNFRVTANSHEGVEPNAQRPGNNYFAILRMRRSLSETYPGP